MRLPSLFLLSLFCHKNAIPPSSQSPPFVFIPAAAFPAATLSPSQTHFSARVGLFISLSLSASFASIGTRSVEIDNTQKNVHSLPLFLYLFLSLFVSFYLSLHLFRSLSLFRSFYFFLYIYLSISIFFSLSLFLFQYLSLSSLLFFFCQHPFSQAQLPFVLYSFLQFSFSRTLTTTTLTSGRTSVTKLVSMSPTSLPRVMAIS